MTARPARIICLENMPYRWPIRVGSHHYADRFAERYEVLWISLPWHLPQVLKGRNPRHRQFNGGRPVRQGRRLWSLTPFTFLPYRRSPGLGAGWIVDRYYDFLLPRMGPLLARLGFDDVELLWFSDPRHISILRHVRARKLAYRCVDDLEHFADVPASLLERERRLIGASDAAFFTSPVLMDKFSADASKAVLLPNGVDFDFFDRPTSAEALPERWRRLLDRDPARNVVYVGAIAEWFDFDAVALLARTFPALRFILAGPRRVEAPAEMRALPNVAMPGPIPYRALPNLLSRCGVGLAPFRVNRMTDAVSPIKLYEYFAAGLSVVSSGMKTVRQLASPAMIYNPGRVCDALERALAEQAAPSLRMRRKQFARSNSWAARFATICGALDLRGSTG